VQVVKGVLSTTSGERGEVGRGTRLWERRKTGVSL